MKRTGQFMLMSAVVIGVILIGVSGTITEIQETEHEVSSLVYDMNIIKKQASDLDFTDKKTRRNFRNMINDMEYQSNMTYWNSQRCFNITLKSQNSRVEMNCVN